jgi:hypothetical protein
MRHLPASHQNPRIPWSRIARTGDGRAWRFSDVISAESFHAPEIYTKLYGRLEAEYQVAFTLSHRFAYLSGSPADTPQSGRSLSVQGPRRKGAGPTAGVGSSQAEPPGASRFRASCEALSGGSAPALALPNLQGSSRQAEVTGVGVNRQRRRPPPRPALRMAQASRARRQLPCLARIARIQGG